MACTDNDDGTTAHNNGKVTISLHAAGCLPDSDHFPITVEGGPASGWEVVRDDLEHAYDYTEDGIPDNVADAFRTQDKSRPGAIPGDANGYYRYVVEYAE